MASIEPNVAEPDPTGLIEVGSYPTAREAFQHGLVVLAFGVPYWLSVDGQQFRLLVEPHAEVAVREQLTSFDRESERWPPPPFAAGGSPYKPELATPLLWCVATAVVYWAQSERPGWTGTGAVDTHALFDRGEWWRAATALFLHADLGHLVSNLFSGVFVFAAVVSVVGRLRGWSLVLASGVLGNFAAAAIRYPQEYRSIGASTAVFGALGVLTGRALRVVWESRARSWRALFAPLASGLAVLGLYGAGGLDIDVLAHATGFAAGLMLGGCLGSPRHGRDIPNG